MVKLMKYELLIEKKNILKLISAFPFFHSLILRFGEFLHKAQPATITMSVLDHTSVDPASFSGITAIAANVLFVFLAVCYIINSKYHVFQGIKFQVHKSISEPTLFHGKKYKNL